MDVMKPDAAREPLENLWQLVERTALYRRREIVPLIMALPVHSLELVLHVEQPHAGRARHRHHCQLDQQIRLETENQTQAGGLIRECPGSSNTRIGARAGQP